jgi:hypothetical protein
LLSDINIKKLIINKQKKIIFQPGSRYFSGALRLMRDFGYLLVLPLGISPFARFYDTCPICAVKFCAILI